ncbi:hypothetical protein CASFOL_026182 [Castilleja foliolosa]|uniref:Uncharacterized protein n=1 Tax=Castilleja foliolosa TaxID=1961234 RepID=A0ABD3CIX2_9LAMI
MAETTSTICFSIFLPRFLFLRNHQFHLHRPRYSVVEDSPRSIHQQDFLPANRTPPGARSFTKTKPNLNLKQSELFDFLAYQVNLAELYSSVFG